MPNVADKDMRSEYDFSGGVRGKHYRAMQAGYPSNRQDNRISIITSLCGPIEHP